MYASTANRSSCPARFAQSNRRHQCISNCSPCPAAPERRAHGNCCTACSTPWGSSSPKPWCATPMKPGNSGSSDRPPYGSTAQISNPPAAGIRPPSPAEPTTTPESPAAKSPKTFSATPYPTHPPRTRMQIQTDDRQFGFALQEYPS